ncbi:MFS transporter [Streptomyces luteolus]|uniref:MFS transporter n=1 Tax=Streptomyces luteolus TaxID=3043615 RepID=A0ABT6TA39_9ACTN|nr:MFS transporter [Streptomyces sp. B-S-A12]MDI3424238.1 MFS transporter [Streptomyces sp. B-S-A12]
MKSSSVVPEAGNKARVLDTDVMSEASPLRNRRFVVFAVGNGINNIGEAMYATALPLLAYRLTGSLGIMTALAAAVPLAMLLAPSLGSVADRWGSRVLVVPGLLLQAASALVMNLLLQSGAASTASLCICTLLVAVGAAAYRTGWMTGVPRMFPDTPVRARGMLNSLFFATTLIGPVLVAGCLPFMGYSGLLWLNLATFFAPIAVWLAGVHPPRVSRVNRGKGHNWKLSQGWRAIVEDRRIFGMLIVQLVIGITCGAGLTTLVVFSLTHTWQQSDGTASVALTVMNASMLVGNLMVTQIKRLRPWVALSFGMAVRTASLLLLSVPSWPVFLVALALGGIGQGAVLSTVVMMRVKYLPEAVLGRASGLMWLITGAAALLSPVIAPLLTDAGGTRGAFLVLGLATSLGLWHLLRSRADWAQGSGPASPASGR